MPTKKLSIPERYREGIALLLPLNDVQVQTLARGLDTTTTMSSSAEFAQVVTVPGIEPTDVSKIFVALLSLYVVRSAENIETSEFVDAIIDAMQSSGDPKLAIADSETTIARSRLSKLLSSSAFSRIAKAEELGDEFPNMVYGTRVLTDLRPVFGESPTVAPLGFLIVHTLKLEYHEHTVRHKEAYLTLSEAELKDLQEAIARALAKSQTLQDALRVSGSTYIQHAKRD